MPFELWNSWRDSNIKWWNVAENNGKKMVLVLTLGKTTFRVKEVDTVCAHGVSVNFYCGWREKNTERKKATKKEMQLQANNTVK